MLFGLVYLPAIELEEQHLTAIMTGYSAYAARVPLLLPRWPDGLGRRAFRSALYEKPRISGRPRMARRSSLAPGPRPLAAVKPEVQLEGFQLEGLIDKYTPEIAAMTRACLAKMCRRLPGAMVLIYDNYNSLAVGFAPSEKPSEAIFSIVPYPRWVTLFFLQGAGLPDPMAFCRAKATSSAASVSSPPVISIHPPSKP